MQKRLKLGYAGIGLLRLIRLAICDLNCASLNNESIKSWNPLLILQKRFSKSYKINLKCIKNMVEKILEGMVTILQTWAIKKTIQLVLITYIPNGGNKHSQTW